jgi:hypothetical protein
MIRHDLRRPPPRIARLALELVLPTGYPEPPDARRQGGQNGVICVAAGVTGAAEDGMPEPVEGLLP